MLDLVFQMFLQAFTTVFTSLQRIELSEGISAWDWIVGCFIAFGILSALVHSIGFSALSDSATRTSAAYQAKQNKQAKQNSDRGGKK